MLVTGIHLSASAGPSGVLDRGNKSRDDRGAGGSGEDKPTRGGSWWYGPAQMRADALYTKPRAFPAVYIGLRCAGD